MKTSVHHLGIFVSLLICCEHFTHGNSAAQECELNIPKNKTFFQKLLDYYDMDGAIIIVEYTLKFNNVSNSFNLSTQSSPDSYQPWKWYSTQGIGSPRLLLIYDFMHGVLRFFLNFCTAKEELPLNVHPPDCLDKFENETLEKFLRNFMLKELNIGNTKVKDLYMCTTKLYVQNKYWHTVIYRCCTLDPFGDSYCTDVEEDDIVHYLFIFICVIIILSVLLLPIVFPSDYRLEIYEFTLPSNITASINVPKEKINPIEIEINDQSFTVPFSLVEKMGNFKNYRQEKSINARLTKILVEVPLNKMFLCDKNQVSFFDIGCQMLSECQRYCYNSFSGYCKKIHSAKNCIQYTKCRNWKNIVKHIFIKICFFFLSVPILILLCVDDSRLWDLRKEVIKRANITETENIGLYVNRGIVAIIYILYFAHFVFFLLWEHKFRRFYTIITNFNTESQYSVQEFGIKNKCMVFVMSLCFTFPNLYNISLTFFLIMKNLYLLVCLINPKTVLFFLIFYLTSYSYCVVSVMGAYFLVGFVVIVILITVMAGGYFYNTIKICLLLVAYFYKSVKQVYELFENFMRMLLNTTLFNDLAIDRRLLKTHPDISVLDKLGKPLFLPEKNDLWVKLNHPFIDVYEKKMSQSFLFRCASADHSEAPGTVVHNFFKAIKRIFQIAVFIIFIYMAVSAYGHTSYISPSNLSFTTFMAALLPIIISNFLMMGTDKRESTEESKKLLLNTIENQIKDFSESWIVYDLEFEEITNNSDTISEPIQPEATGNTSNAGLLMERENRSDGEANTEIGIWRLAQGIICRRGGNSYTRVV